MSSSPYVFDEFFASGQEENVSPFLTPSSKKYAKNLNLIGSIISAIFLSLAFAFSFNFKEISHVFLVVVYFLSGTKALIETIEDIKNFEINIDVLMTLAAFLSVLIDSALEGGLLLVLFALSGAMENTVSKKSKGALNNLNNLAPSFATMIEEDGSIYEKSIKDVEVGSKILIKAQEVIPLDGAVVYGSSFVNLVHLTGESQPISKKVGDLVQAGSRNLDGSLTIEVTKKSSESTLSKIIQLVHQAQETKPTVQKILDKFGKAYALTIIFLSLFFALALPWILSISYLGIEGSIYRALAFLIAASPCALIIATPTAYLSAISACAKKGILLKGGLSLDALAKCSSFAFDKTGTLTTGELICSKITPITGNLSIHQAISIAASLEKHATHPIAKALVQLGKEKNIPLIEIQNFRSIAGYGLEGQVIIENDPCHVYIGNADYFLSQENKALATKIRDIITQLSLAYCILKIKDSYILFEFSDKLRDNLKDQLSTFKKLHNIKLMILTGDHKASAIQVSQFLGVDHVYHDLKPENKLNIIADLSKKGSLAMVGDGINDAPALARANVGIAMGGIGSSAAIDASDIVLLHDDLSLIPWLYSKAKKTLQIVRENLSLALIVILCATTPALLGFIPLWLAVILHEGGTLIVGLNSLRLLKK